MKPDIMIVLHWDQKGVLRAHGVVDELKVDDALRYAMKKDIMVLNAPYKEGTFLCEEAFEITGDYPLWCDDWAGQSNIKELLKGCRILLVGGYRSLCIRDAYNRLKKEGIDVVTNPDWIVRDPSWYNENSALRKRDGLSFLWEYPSESILSV